jgi:regulator of sigma E protease
LEILNVWGRGILAFVFVLGVMIFVHELGHYVAAKSLRIRVLVFSLGFGPRLFGFKWNDTDYRVCALPLGGYVKMAGENYEDALSGRADEFLSRPKHQRFMVAAAGPLMNVALALLLTWAHFWSGVEIDAVLKQPATIAKVEANSPAEKAGLQINDTVVAINDMKVSNWNDLSRKGIDLADRMANLQILRDGRVLTKKITFGSTGDNTGILGAGPVWPYVVESVEKNTPAEQAGMRAGDTILQVSARGEAASDAYEIAQLINANKNQPVQIKIRRGEQVLEKTVVPRQMDGGVRIGIRRHQTIQIERFGFFESWKMSATQCYDVTTLTIQILARIITGRDSLRQMSGPIEIAKYSGMAAEEGAMALLRFIALISLQLGIFNLLPIPILDGGVIALLAIEGLMRRDMSLQVKQRIFQVGFIFLIILMGIIIFNDIAKQLPTS